MVNESAKWKAQSLYDRMLASDRWDPVIGRTIIKTDALFPKETVRARADDLLSFFEKRKMRCVDAANFKTFRPLPLDVLQPDIVFYQQPWGLYPCQFPSKVSKFALACYIPYYVQGFGVVDTACRLPFHRLLYRYFVQSESWAKELASTVFPIFFAPEILGLGHTMLDQFQTDNSGGSVNGPVIYAPHWSFAHPKHQNTLNLSTFLKNGRQILAFAQEHPQIKWAFRPHPTLRGHLCRTGVWSKSEVDSYYAAWEEIGEASYTGDYVDLFRRSRAMITDCDSFLGEYPATGKPLIRLESSDRKIEPMKPARELFSTLYTARSMTDLVRLFDDVVLKGNDPAHDKRIKAARAAGLIGNDAADNILNYLESLLEMKKNGTRNEKENVNDNRLS